MPAVPMLHVVFGKPIGLGRDSMLDLLTKIRWWWTHTRAHTPVISAVTV